MARKRLGNIAAVVVFGAMSIAPGVSRAGTVTVLHSAVGCPTVDELAEIDTDALDNPDSAVRSQIEALHIMVRHGDCQILDGGRQVVLIQRGPHVSVVAVHPEDGMPATLLYVRSEDISRGFKTVHPRAPAPPAVPAPAAAGRGTELIN